MNEEWQRILKNIKKEQQFRTIPKLKNHSQKYTEINNIKYLNLSSNNYLGLADNLVLKENAKKAIDEFGCSATASRLVSGNFDIYEKLESAVAIFKNTQRALVFNTGYVANLSLLQSLAKNAEIYSDKLNHASIVDGILLSGSKFFRYSHCDMDALERFLKKGSSNKIIITDTIFSMDGDAAPLIDIAKLAKKYGAVVIADEAHATGVFGEGRGLAHHLGIENDIDVHMGTFSKALGSFGAYVASNNLIIDYLINTARGFIFSTALPPAVIGANLAGINYLQNNPSIGNKLLSMADEFRNFLKSLGFNVGNSISQIIPIILNTNELTLKAQKILLEKGVFVGAIRPPSVPFNTSRLRLSLRADLDKNDISLVKEAFSYLRKVL